MSRLNAIALALAVAGAAAACAHNVAAPVPRPQLTGRWVPARSDTASAAHDSTTERPVNLTLPGREREGRGGTRGGYGGEREGGGNNGPRYDAEALGAAMAAATRGEDRVNIVQTDSTVHIDFADGSYFDVPTDGRRRDDIWRGIGRIQSSARWTLEGLVFERRTEEGVTITQTLARATAGNRLVITTVVKGPAPRPITARHVLEPAAS